MTNKDQDIEHKIKRVIAEQLAFPVSKLSNKSRLVKDLDADDLDMIELIMALEDTFDIEINDTDFERLTTVGDVVNYISYKLPKKNDYSEFVDLLKDKLQIEIEYHKSYAYWDSNEIKVRILFDGEEISSSTTNIGD